MNKKNRKVSFTVVDKNEQDQHFQFVQNLAKNFDRSHTIKADFKRSSSGTAVTSPSCCNSTTYISMNNMCVEVSSEFQQQYNLLKDDKELSGEQKIGKDIEYSTLKDIEGISFVVYYNLNAI